MTQKQAHRRYMKVFAPSMIVYVLGVFGVVSLRNQAETGTSILAALALIPALSMLVWIWGHWRYINELDEFLQKLQVQSIMVGLGITLSIASVWGLLEMLVQDPGFPVLQVFLIVPIFFVANGLALVIISKRAGVKGNLL